MDESEEANLLSKIRALTEVNKEIIARIEVAKERHIKSVFYSLSSTLPLRLVVTRWKRNAREVISLWR